MSINDLEIQWMMDFQRGNEDAFVKILKRYERPLVNFAFNFLADRQAAEDAAQDVLLEIYRRKAHYKPIGKFSTWVFTMASHRCLNIKRKKSFLSLTSLDQSLEGDSGQRQHEPLDPQELSPPANLERKELERVIRDALAILPEHQRAAVLLAKYEDMAIDEIAQVLNTSVGAVKQLLFRAKNALKNKLKPYL